ncbi:hypothetical protein YC2023_015564 [Brassica napus]
MNSGTVPLRFSTTQTVENEEEDKLRDWEREEDFDLNLPDFHSRYYLKSLEIVEKITKTDGVKQ